MRHPEPEIVTLYRNTLDSDGLPYWKPVYTSPPQREWVGLTDEEIEAIEEKALTKQWAIRMALTAAQEKNT